MRSESDGGLCLIADTDVATSYEYYTYTLTDNEFENFLTNTYVLEPTQKITPDSVEVAENF